MLNENGGINYAKQDALSVREYAAIQLRIPDSGNAELDAMIRKAQRRDVAIRLFAEYEGYSPERATWAADSLLAALENTK